MQKGLGGWLTEADTLIIVLSCVFNWRDEPYPGLASAPNDMWAISTGACVQNMMIAATTLALGTKLYPFHPRLRRKLGFFRLLVMLLPELGKVGWPSL